MIKASKEILAYLGIEHSYITGGRNAFCVPVELGANVWCVAVDTAIADGRYTLHIKRRGAYIEFEAALKKSEGALLYEAAFDQAAKRIPPVRALFAEIKELEARRLEWEGRSEERYEVGLNGYEAFGFASPEQYVIQGAYRAPCLITNVSSGGIQFTTFERPDFRENAGLRLELRFREPSELAELNGYIRHIYIKDGTGSARFAVVSLKISGEAAAYKKRLARYALEHSTL